MGVGEWLGVEWGELESGEWRVGSEEVVTGGMGEVGVGVEVGMGMDEVEVEGTDVGGGGSVS